MPLLETLALISAGSGLVGQLGSIFGGGSKGYSTSDIDEMISKMRQRGSAQVGGQVSRAKVKSAQSFASRGLGDSTMSLDSLMGIEGMGLDALADLEGSLAGTEMQMMDALAQLQQRQSMFKQQQLSDIFGSISDLGTSYLLGKYFPKTQINIQNPYGQDSLSSTDEDIYGFGFGVR